VFFEVLNLLRFSVFLYLFDKGLNRDYDNIKTFKKIRLMIEKPWEFCRDFEPWSQMHKGRFSTI
jgi:hypothetical protein